MVILKSCRAALAIHQDLNMSGTVEIACSDQRSVLPPSKSRGPWEAGS